MEEKKQISFKGIIIFLLIIIIFLILYFNNAFFYLTWVTKDNINYIITSGKLSEQQGMKLLLKEFRNENIYNKFLFQILK